MQTDTKQLFEYHLAQLKGVAVILDVFAEAPKSISAHADAEDAYELLGCVLWNAYDSMRSTLVTEKEGPCER